MKTGRNDPCPCESGLKYKKCCGGGVNAFEPDDIPQQSEHYFNHLEAQFDSSNGSNVFLIMKLLRLDDEHGDQNIIEAVRYFVDKDCLPEGDAPTNFLTDSEVSAINRDGNFRPKLYSMLLARTVAEGISNKTLFFPDSYKYARESDRH